MKHASIYEQKTRNHFIGTTKHTYIRNDAWCGIHIKYKNSKRIVHLSKIRISAVLVRRSRARTAREIRLREPRWPRAELWRAGAPARMERSPMQPLLTQRCCARACASPSWSLFSTPSTATPRRLLTSHARCALVRGWPSAETGSFWPTSIASRHLRMRTSALPAQALLRCPAHACDMRHGRGAKGARVSARGAGRTDSPLSLHATVLVRRRKVYSELTQ